MFPNNWELNRGIAAKSFKEDWTKLGYMLTIENKETRVSIDIKIRVTMILYSKT